MPELLIGVFPFSGQLQVTPSTASHMLLKQAYGPVYVSLLYIPVYQEMQLLAANILLTGLGAGQLATMNKLTADPHVCAPEIQMQNVV